MALIVVCSNCGSEMRHRHSCPSCLGLTDEEWALRGAREDYAADRIGLGELEERIVVALTAPPRPQRSHFVYC